MTNSASEFQRRLRAGDTQLGTLIVSPSPRWPQSVRDSRLDFVFIDTEHIALDRHMLSWMCQTYGALGLPPLVRIPSPDPYAASMVLDGGAAGVIAPYIESVEQVLALSGAVKMRPVKGQRLNDFLHGVPMPPQLEAYLQTAASRSSLIVNIESLPALRALDEIVRTPGLDAVLIGPHDLSCSLGLPEQYEHPDFLAACETIFIKARAAGIGAGIHFWGEPQQQVRWLEMGANLLIHSGDVMLVRKHLRREIDAIRELAGLTSAIATTENDNI